MATTWAAAPVCGQLNPNIKVACFADSLDRMRDPLTYSKAIRAAFPEYSPAAPAVLDGMEPDLLLKDGDRLGRCAFCIRRAMIRTPAAIWTSVP